MTERIAQKENFLTRIYRRKLAARRAEAEGAALPIAGWPYPYTVERKNTLLSSLAEKSAALLAAEESLCAEG